uniref:Aldo-keto reductase n=2 Tax=Kwoniella pini CBS 10737 TaxID=1296096 RepID=A0A1B9I660_9TREE|nr:aldo-keto reductase [Kwoniella pini CBS 10737]OCF50971.1 aldo-keto reductase [Kwoniella pini CBS 10737]
MKMSLSIESTIKLASGHSIPQLGYGVYQARSKECEDGVKDAITAGYRHVDSAQGYHNEDIVGRAVIQSGLPRSEIFLTTKYMPSHTVHSTESVLDIVRKSLKKIDRTGDEKPYIDLMLIHAPFGGEQGRANNWDALVKAQKEGWIRDIGVSNFGVKHLQALPSPKPSINQIELHPFCQQKDIVKYCEENGIAIEAYSPLIRADKNRYENPVLKNLAKKHNKEIAQILIRWSLQKGYIPLPKSVTPSRIKSNADVYDFELTSEDMKALDGLDEGAKGACTWNPIDQP